MQHDAHVQMYECMIDLKIMRYIMRQLRRNAR